MHEAVRNNRLKRQQPLLTNDYGLTSNEKD